MNQAVFECSKCNEPHTHQFSLNYRPFRVWFMTCPKCRKYGAQILKALVGSGVSAPGPAIRESRILYQAEEEELNDPKYLKQTEF
jgi:hypothetical protein